ncbi:ACP S-malonyltransferase [Lentibacter algarum]|uniref:ACP S-malonyltransferase n=1 Tax=Lentibacter algarum TaxID=576131 RepID=UPI001C079D22|nr:ACP S-malonyltransferase [Lentibacter algarum]MBU2980242.1 ACP S-malonyltransferase [Lentibacter algarum]
MKQTAVIIAPGRGTYNKTELGYLAKHHPNSPALAKFDAYRTAQGQTPVSELDSAARFVGPTHTRGDNASPLIYACSLFDFAAINRERFDIVGVTGNSMGWYTALACAGALDAMSGLRVVNTMGRLMQEQMLGGQLIYPFVDDNWHEVAGQRTALMSKVTEINARADHTLGLSIDLGGMLVLAGNEAGLSAFETSVPPLQGRYPMRLPNHAGFHTHLQIPVSKLGFESLPKDLFQQPEVPLIDGRGFIWNPKATDINRLYDYTLGHQVTETYDYTAAIRTAARELMPDVFIVLGPGTTLGGATAQSLILSNWQGWASKPDFQKAVAKQPKLLAMGMEEQRAYCV